MAMRRILRRTIGSLALAAMPFCALSCGGGGGGGRGGGGGGGPPVAADLASVTPTPEAAAAGSNPGDFAADFLRSKNFTSLEIEVDYPVGHVPSAAALLLLHDRLVERCDKPLGIDIFLDDAIPASEFPATVTLADLDDLERAHRHSFSDLATRTAAYYVLYVTGQSDLDGNKTEVVGLAYHGSSLAIFVDNTVPTSPFTTADEFEGATLVHESGHMLGLVDGGVPMVTPHEDTTHGGHCAFPSCIMYWLLSVPSHSSIADPGFAEFEADCAQDLAAFGGRTLSTAVIGVPTAQAPADSFVLGVCGNATIQLPPRRMR